MLPIPIRPDTFETPIAETQLDSPTGQGIGRAQICITILFILFK